MSRRALTFALPALVLALLLVALSVLTVRPATSAGARAAAAASPVASDNPPRSISVNGEGRIAARPDLAYASFAVETASANLAQAQSDNASRMTAVIDKLKGSGIDEKDLQTTGYNIAPQYDKDNKLTGYRVSNGVRATVRDIAKLGATIDLAVGAGATRVNGISFDIAKKDDIIRQAREAAVKDARDKAEQYARLTNVQLGGPLSIVEGSTPQRAPQPAAAPAGAARADAPTTPIEVGEGVVTLLVQIVFEIR